MKSSVVDNTSALTKPEFRLAALAGIVLTVIFIAYRRLYNELQTFPGPKLASLTRYYIGYYDFFRNGGWLEHLKELHDKHGPVVRTGPQELHFKDPHAYATIYSSTTRFEKDPHYYEGFGVDRGSFTIIDPAESRARRSIVSPFFSKRSVDQVEHLVQKEVDLLVKHLSTSKGPINLLHAYYSVTLDVISSYSFGQSFNATEYPGFNHPFILSIEASARAHALLRQFKFLKPVLLNLPPWLLQYIAPDSRGFITLKNSLGGQIDALIKDPATLEQAGHKTIFHRLLEPQQSINSGSTVLPKEILLSEGITLIGAGTDTVGNACTFGTFHILSNPAVYDRLVQELDTAWPDPGKKMTNDALSKLPYLTAVIKESLRLSHGVVTPMPRIVGPSSAEIAGFVIPAGTVVSCGATFVHLNPEIFSDPHSFIPDRWLQPNSNELENYLVPFSRGPRACIGINLAWCEMYLILANVFRKLKLKTYETTPKDLEFGDLYLPNFRGKIRATVTPRSA